VKWHWSLSAGEFFELLRPAALMVSGLISTWVFASARRRYFGLAASLTWAIATFLLPFVVLPIYLIVRAPRKLRPLLATSESDAAETIKFRWLLPVGYALVLISLVCAYLYRDYASVDAHLARAAQATVMGQHERAIREYRAALQLGEDAHVHKLLGIQLAEARRWMTRLMSLRRQIKAVNLILHFHSVSRRHSMKQDDLKRRYEAIVHSLLVHHARRPFQMKSARLLVNGQPLIEVSPR
jgi:hypothetical protein